MTKHLGKFALRACAVVFVATFLTTGITACSSRNSDGSESGDSTNPDPLADLNYATSEEVPIIIGFEPASASAQFTIISNPEFGQITLEPGNKQFTYTPEKNFFGYDRIAYSDGKSDTILNVLVRNVNDEPFLYDDVQRVAEQGVLYQIYLNADDPDNDQLVYSTENLPVWLSLNSDTGALSGTPSQRQVGMFEGIAFKVTDPFGEFSEIRDISIEVLDINDAPTINPDQFPSEIRARAKVMVNVFPDDPDGDFVSITVEPNDFVSVVIQGGSVEVTAADVSDVSSVNLVVIATDSRGNVAREIIPLTILPQTTSTKGLTLRGRKKGAGIHLVILGDGYRADQQGEFRQHVNEFVEKLEKDEGIAPHFDAWNVHMVESISIDSGIDDDFAFDLRDTAFGAGYFCASIQRLICADSLKVIETAFSEYPDFQQIILIVNDTRYGGSGGQFSVASSSYPEVSLHELGHSFAGLADEYVDETIPKLSPSSYTEGLYANISTFDDPATVPWAHWLTLDDNTEVGIYEGAFYQANDFYRATPDSRMRSYDKSFGPVNSEQWALRVYEAAKAVIDFSPVASVVTIPSGQTQEFSVVPLLNTSVQRISWTLDGELVTSQTNNRIFTQPLLIGDHTLSVLVEDITGQIRKPTPHAGQFIWNWNIEKQ
ncbi:MAG: M64 family metallopeptidase [Granulosicoccaceae bacterium]